MTETRYVNLDRDPRDSDGNPPLHPAMREWLIAEALTFTDLSREDLDRLIVPADPTIPSGPDVVAEHFLQARRAGGQLLDLPEP